MENDPIGFAGGSNDLYGFVGDNTANNTDPTGLEHRSKEEWKAELKSMKEQGFAISPGGGMTPEEGRMGIGLLQVLGGTGSLVASAAATLSGNPVGIAGMGVSLDVMASGFVAVSSGGTKKRETMTSRIFQDAGMSSGEAETWVTAFMIAGGASKTPEVAPLRVPQGLNHTQFNQAGATIRQATGHLGNDVVAQGSRAAGTAHAASDIDFAIRLSDQEFAAFVRARFGTPNPGSAAERTMQMAIQNGRVHAGEAGLRGVRTQLQQQLGMDVDIAVIRRGGPFDQGQSIPVPRGN